eukprot:m.4057 g.4057  ORF g.4057 m.4057 type:complete len:711 (+) comp2895_c0_seq1:241-2373(+)
MSEPNLEVDAFLDQVDQVSDLIKGLSNPGDSEDIIKKADDWLKHEKPKGKDRMVINKSTQSNAEVIPSDSQASFLSSLEKDAAERAARREKREKRAEELKILGNTAFKEGKYKEAVELYMEAIGEDKGNALLHTNCAQAHLKLGNFEKALERCDFAIRIDEACVKAHLRRGIALRSMGDYDEAMKSFVQARTLAPEDQRKTFDRHIDETNIANGLAKKEKELEQAMKSGKDEESFKGIDRRLSQLILPAALTPEEYTKSASKLRTLIKHPLHQELFRVRKGTRLLTDGVCKRYFEKLKLEEKPVDTQEFKTLELCVTETLNLLVVAIRGNDTSRRDVFTNGAQDVAFFTQFLEKSSASVIEASLCVLREASQCSHVCKLAAVGSSAKLAQALLHVASKSSYKDSIRSEALLVLAQLCLQEAFRRSLVPKITTILPQLSAILPTNGSLAASSMAVLTNLAKDTDILSKMSTESYITPFVGFMHHWARDIFRKSGKECQGRSLLLHQLLRLLLNICANTNSGACAVLQQPINVDYFAALLEVTAENVHTLTATLLARICTTRGVAESLVSNEGMAQLQDMAANMRDNEDLLDAVVKIAVKVITLYPTGRSVIAQDKALQLWVSLLKCNRPTVLGNSALCLSECAKDPQVCVELVGSNVVSDLLELCKRDKSKITENCAIALARLASGHPEHTARLRQLGGFEVLHSRAPSQR